MKETKPDKVIVGILFTKSTAIQMSIIWMSIQNYWIVRYILDTQIGKIKLQLDMNKTNAYNFMLTFFLCLLTGFFLLEKANQLPVCLFHFCFLLRQSDKMTA